MNFCFHLKANDQLLICLQDACFSGVELGNLRYCRRQYNSKTTVAEDEEREKKRENEGEKNRSTSGISNTLFVP